MSAELGSMQIRAPCITFYNYLHMAYLYNKRKVKPKPFAAKNSANWCIIVHMHFVGSCIYSSGGMHRIRTHQSPTNDTLFIKILFVYKSLHTSTLHSGSVSASCNFIHTTDTSVILYIHGSYTYKKVYVCCWLHKTGTRTHKV
jgi:hypothetical protein